VQESDGSPLRQRGDRLVTEVVVLVPRRADSGHRDSLWAFARAWWLQQHPDWPLFEGVHEYGPFNRAAAINQAADKTEKLVYEVAA